MFIIEVVVCSGVELDYIILRGVSNNLATTFTCMRRQILERPCSIQALQQHTSTKNDLNNKHKVKLCQQKRFNGRAVY